jgi:hypothetical protein
MKKATGYRLQATGSGTRTGFGTRYQVGALREASSSPVGKSNPRARSLNLDDANSNGTCRGGSRTAQTRVASPAGSEERTHT